MKPTMAKKKTKRGKYHGTLSGVVNQQKFLEVLARTGAIAAAERLRKLYGNQMFGVGLSFTEDSEVVGVDLDAALANGQRADHLAWMLGNIAAGVIGLFFLQGQRNQHKSM